MNIRFLFLLGSLILTSCHGAKYHYKQGNKFAQAHMLKPAVTEYKKALDKKPKKVKFLIAMEHQGSALLEELYTNYRFADGNDSLSVYRFLEADKWTTYLKKYISVDRYEGFYELDYQQQLSNYTNAVYNRSKLLVRSRSFDKAQLRLSELETLRPGFRDVTELLTFSEVEPIYTKALTLFEQGSYRAAFAVLKPIVLKYPKQEELQTLKDEALSRGIYRLGIISDPQITGKAAAISAALQSRLISALYANKDPFIELLDRTNFDLLQDEQQAIINGGTSEEAVTQELLSAHAYLKVVVTSVDEEEGSLISQRKTGYERYFVDKKDDEGKTIKEAKYTKVRYQEFTKENKVHYTAQLTLTDRATSKIIAVESYEYANSDRAHYIEYSGNNLFPGYWKYQNKAHHSDRPEINESKRRQLANLKKASRSVKSPVTMRKDAVASFASRSASAVKLLKLEP